MAIRVMSKQGSSFDERYWVYSALSFMMPEMDAESPHYSRIMG